jgi:DNA mismatch endonuclease (patch repair protein)
VPPPLAGSRRDPARWPCPKANREWWVAKLAGNTARDRRADAVLRAGGWRVLRFWEHEDPDAVADAICAALGRPPSGP